MPGCVKPGVRLLPFPSLELCRERFKLSYRQNGLELDGNGCLGERGGDGFLWNSALRRSLVTHAELGNAGLAQIRKWGRPECCDFPTLSAEKSEKDGARKSTVNPKAFLILPAGGRRGIHGHLHHAGVLKEADETR